MAADKAVGGKRSLLDLSNIKRDSHELHNPTYLQLEPVVFSSSKDPAIYLVAKSPTTLSSSKSPPEQGSMAPGAGVVRDRICALFLDKDQCREFLEQDRLYKQESPLTPLLDARQMSRHARGNKMCPRGCGQGNCHHDLGICMCPAGWKGATCSEAQPRPCTHRAGRGVQDPIGAIMTHIHPVTKHDLN
jgi:hypothetical protein